ncbi:bifunctional 4-hydroxy-3-methylbut-2-enyl diphosphate reductase/30S ribosomal protein S1 [Clostridium acetobutylicum]|uniref:4-hydroxy-3-methylbut-2-enyl diphosphate reductase n=1 Tax=Clostridium acetobutylicum (strain ATCC 824 / DSM 792 / JCM 1419 / IAM 19013 / LMG 5710 / NBRC 13948 / NRRL B-527 / VKM B-1787 / 2291 / W) TaxID=272562 RepID=ISPH_CLOAB|nr:bifunctional 4-hydroxy-3-methylbut-2-enyl diphosphate reductase/30S ribosomal protein S1 [Clostridium acetobutylicum]Q97I09.1 RecName: Full=4-hydroxy-3-methylbut-2-enyl diphosphate reductase; Short=HMBPP reductase [Clostridium acetobutylicum ATCC 824]AAK79811.1 penicillin tolerance LytB domain/S1 ribosomal protein fusion [Clostridium acetobutylicum ATCC 824]
MRKVMLAEKAGFCFGVKRAVDMALLTQKEYNKKIYTLGELIHNNDVVDKLKDNNVYPIGIEDIDNLKENDVILIRSHGISEEIYKILLSKGLTVINATCPFVTKIQEKVKKYNELGYDIVIVGDKYHPEVIGINGWCDNKAIISKQGENLENITSESKVCIVSQTTEKLENWEKVLKEVKNRAIEVISFNTICNATSERQKIAKDLSNKVDFMVVIGGKQSSNTTKLYEICKSNCNETIHVENSGEIPENILKNKNCVIGVTAGASTPDWIIEEAISKMSENQISNETNNEMADAMKFIAENEGKIYVGASVTGEIIQVSEKEVFLNINYKRDGVIPKSEIDDDGKDLKELFTVGDKIVAKIIKLKDADNYVVLSVKELQREQGYKEIKEAFENKTTLNVVVKEDVKGGIIASYKGIRIFIPASHVELFHVDNLKEYIGKSFDVAIIEYSTKKRQTKIVASRRALLSKEKEKVEETVWNKLEEGQVVEGEVKRLTDFGAFVEIEGVDGLLHVSEISWGRVEKPADVLKIGDKIKVYVLSVDKENKKLSLSVKKLTENPWNNVEEKYPVGSVVLGKVIRFADFGAFVKLEPGVDGLVHISEISHKRIAKPSDALNVGEEIKAKILEVSSEEKKIGLSIREVEE